MVDFDRRADELSNRFHQQLEQFRHRPSQYGFLQLTRTYNELLSALEEAQRNLSNARQTYFEQLSAARRAAILAERRKTAPMPY